MAIHISKAPHFEGLSASFGTTRAEMKAAEGFATALKWGGASTSFDVCDIGGTDKNPSYRLWQRAKGRGHSCRIAFEAWRDGDDVYVIIHCVFPRSKFVYDDVLKAWAKYRSSISVKA